MLYIDCRPVADEERCETHCIGTHSIEANAITNFEQWRIVKFHHSVKLQAGTSTHDLARNLFSFHVIAIMK